MSVRQIVLDTETTGIGHDAGHRLIEIGCLELVDRKLTDRHFHVYLNPERLVDPGAFRVHGLSDDFLKDKPLFSKIAHEFLDFVKGSELIIHNAPFDVGFINAELKRASLPPLFEHHCTILDTLVMSKKMHPGQRHSLDALCKRYDVNNQSRQLHGALLDAGLLASVYLAMTGGQQSLFAEVMSESKPSVELEHSSIGTTKISAHQLPIIKADADELVRHQAFIERIARQSGRNHW